MSNTIRKFVLVSAAALGTLSFAAAASAAPVGGAYALKNSAPSSVDHVRWGGHGGWHGGHGWHGGGWGWGVGAGLATGAIIGSALAAPYYYGGYYPGYGGYYDDPGYYAQDPGYYAEPYGGGGDATGYCMQRYRSYNPRTGTYLGNDGYRHPCP